MKNIILKCYDYENIQTQILYILASNILYKLLYFGICRYLNYSLGKE